MFFRDDSAFGEPANLYINLRVLVGAYFPSSWFGIERGKERNPELDRELMVSPTVFTVASLLILLLVSFLDLFIPLCFQWGDPVLGSLPQ